MNLQNFLKIFNKNESDLREIETTEKAMKAVKQDGYALRFVRRIAFDFKIAEEK